MLRLREGNRARQVQLASSIPKSRAMSISQTEKAFLRQPTVFNARKKALGRRHGKGLRFARNVGLGIKTPTEVFTVS